MKKDITECFVWLDDFCMAYDLFLNSNIGNERKPTRVPGLKTSEVMTIIMLFHQSPAKNFKFFYESYLQQYLSEFPGLPSYNRFLELQQRVLGHFHGLLLILWSRVEDNGIRLRISHFNCKRLSNRLYHIDLSM